MSGNAYSHDAQHARAAVRERLRDIEFCDLPSEARADQVRPWMYSVMTWIVISWLCASYALRSPIEINP